MEKLKDKYKKFKLNKNDLIKSFFIIILLLFFLFIYLNQYSIQYIINGFNSISHSRLQVYYLDVGQANSTLVILPNNMSMLIDAGSQKSENEMIKNIDIILNKNKIHSIDYLILTHPDEDHVGGAVSVLERYQVYNVLRPKVLSTSNIEIENDFNYKVVMTDIYARVITAVYNEPDCEVEFVRNDLFMAGTETTIKFFACEKDIYSDTNSYSPFITITYQDSTFMFTGDATQAREKEFVETVRNSNLTVNVDFLLVSHHGSKYSTTKEFLDVVNPTYAFISAGDKDHPSNEVITRLNDNGVKQVFITKKNGMIGVGIELGGNFYIKTLSSFVDLPFIIIAFAIVIFMLMKTKPYDYFNRLSHKRCFLVK